VGDVELLLADLVVLQPLTAVLEVVFKHVAQRVQLDIVAGPCRPADVLSSPAAPAAATDQADLDRIAAGGVGVGQQAQADRSRGRVPQEIAPRGGRGPRRGWLSHGSFSLCSNGPESPRPMRGPRPGRDTRLDRSVDAASRINGCSYL